MNYRRIPSNGGMLFVNQPCPPECLLGDAVIAASQYADGLQVNMEPPKLLYFYVEPIVPDMLNYMI